MTKITSSFDWSFFYNEGKEEDKMKKILLIVMILFAFFGLQYKASAATSTSQAGIVSTDGSNLNVRASATTSSSILSKLPNKSYVTVLSTSGSFYYVEYKENTYGYVHKSYVDIVSSNVKRVNADGYNLNVRYGPSTSYAQFEKVKDKDYVIVLSNSGSFSRVLFEGNKVGYVSNDYLVSSTAYQAISLSVPSYKQYDSRWANIKIGSYGKTMAQIGCLTTAMAMSESYRTGTTITPAMMKYQSSYTSDGSMYWPNHYTTQVTSSYLSKAYSLLKQNKPVLIGLKNKYGGQHWVLIKGYTGGNTLSASQFIINDPGSSSNTRLSQILASYPNVYKIAYWK